MSAVEIQAKCAIFDMDGTLIDTTRAITDHWEEYASKHGLDAKEVRRKTSYISSGNHSSSLCVNIT